MDAMGRFDIKEARRVQLIEATIASIAKRGFAETTLAHVADGAKLSRGIVNFYFHSKEELLVETLRHMAREYEAFWKTAVTKAGPAPADKLDAMIEADFHPTAVSRKHVTVWYAFWGEARWRPEYLKLCIELSDSYFAQTRALCQEIIDAGFYAEVDATAVARGINAMIDGLWLDILINPKSVDRAEAKRTCRTFLARFFPNEFSAAGGARSAA
jgi:TetR/AcrR family transcriptional repressor of bet genes